MGTARGRGRAGTAIAAIVALSAGILGIGTPAQALDTPHLVLTAPGFTPVYGEALRVQAVLSQATPDGTIAFFADGAPIPGCEARPLDIPAGLGAFCLSGALAPGNYTITAHFSGSGTLAAVDQDAPVVVTVDRGPLELTYTGPASIVPGVPTIVSATVEKSPPGRSGSPVGGRSVLFQLDSGEQCSAVSAADGVAQCLLSSTAVGAHVLTISTPGDANYDGDTIHPGFEVSPIVPSMNVSTPTPAPYWGQIFAITAQLPSDATGTVAFTIGGSPVPGCAGSVPLSAIGSATCASTGIGSVGPQTVTVSYSGDARYASKDAPFGITIRPRVVVVELQTLPELRVGVPATFGILVRDGLTATGVPGLIAGLGIGGAECSGVTDPSGLLACTLTPRHAGEMSLLFLTGASTLYQSSTGSIGLSDPVLAAPTSIALSAPSGTLHGQPVTITATVAGTDGSGTVAFSSGAMGLICSASPLVLVEGLWTATCTTALLPVGAPLVQANYSGTPDYEPSSNQLGVPVLPNPQTVSFDSAGGSAVAPQAVEFGDPAARPADPMRAGYDFLGWFASGDAPYDFATPVTAPLVLAARWEIQVSTVEFASAGGSAVASVQVPYGSPLPEPADPTRTGYSFLGWFAPLADDPYPFGAAVVTGDLVLTAHWRIDVYEVAFDSDGGTAVPEQRVEYQALVDEPPAPTQQGFVFAGWFAPGANTPYDFTSPLTGNLQLTARWLPVHIESDAPGGALSVVAGEPAAIRFALLSTVGIVPTEEGDWSAEADDAALAVSLDPGADAITVRSTVAGDYLVTIRSALGAVQAEVAVTVVPGEVASLALVASDAHPRQGGTVAIAVTGLDEWGNVVADLSADVVLTSSIASDVVTGTSVTFPHASPHVITATYRPTGATGSVLVEVQPESAAALSGTGVAPAGPASAALLALLLGVLLIALGVRARLRRTS